MELISNIKKRFNDWAYNLLIKIGNKHNWHHLRMQIIKEKTQQSKNKIRRVRPIERQNKINQIKTKLLNKRGRKR